jgi:hypothetical protein
MDEEVQQPFEDPRQVYLRKRQMAYAHVFNKENQFLETVMEDLAKFCRARESTFHVEQRVHAVLEGRREVYLRIQDHLTLSPDKLLEKYGKGNGNG